MNDSSEVTVPHAGVLVPSREAFAWAWVLSVAAVKLFLHLAASGRYGYFRDELYYIACGEHLAWGYVDQPPLVALLARLSRSQLGDSLFAIRFLPAVAGAAIVFLTAWIARELGGKRFAQFLAALAALFAPALIAFDSFLSMNAFEPFFWMLIVVLVIRMVNGSSDKLWLIAGVAGGIGILNKYPILAFGFCLIVTLFAFGPRRVLWSRWILIGGIVALATALPNFVWQAQHLWPQIEAVRNAQQLKNVPVAPAQFLFEQVLFLHPVALPIWLGGSAWLLFSRRAREFRFLGLAFLLFVAIVMIFHGKTYYTLSAYPMLLAAGGVAIEEWVQARARRWLAPAYASVLVLAGLLTLPFGAPVLSARTFLRYQQLLPFAQHVKTERDANGPLPQLYADMQGWDEMVATVGRVYHSLPAIEQPGCAILTGNYGEAGAVDVLGRRYGLPKAISGHNNYYLWGPRDYTGECVISLGVEYQKLEELFGEITPAAVVANPLGMPVESNLPVYICRKPKAPLREMWPRLKYYM